MPVTPNVPPSRPRGTPRANVDSDQCAAPLLAAMKTMGMRLPYTKLKLYGSNNCTLKSGSEIRKAAKATPMMNNPKSLLDISNLQGDAVVVLIIWR